MPAIAKIAYAWSMSADVKLAHVASLLADPARARIVLALMDGRARTAKELAFLAGIGAPTASTHLARLRDLGLVAVTPQGRHRYHRIASPLVAEMVEAISAVAGGLEPVARRPAHGRPQLRLARTCYDHLAGRLGVAIADRLRADGLVILGDDGGEVTDEGMAFLSARGFLAERPKSGRRIFCRPCVDWTERRLHVAGFVGAAILSRVRDLDWVRAERDSRALVVTAAGRKGFADAFRVDVASLEAADAGTPAH